MRKSVRVESVQAGFRRRGSLGRRKQEWASNQGLGALWPPPGRFLSYIIVSFPPPREEHRGQGEGKAAWEWG